ncbi:dihydrofolate reductase family protein [Methylobrevis albus]|uniref:Dihydrofolate reductase n=1 Tax=Methylobrevis albus TaxID=2793297 RepID=A0A931I4Y8_9HYPH|nr:dihydrofolate reductase family protein [Methylobrevis albus]MBH0239300.1 dihydrofolate reductase [Methylobrevis albus]
MTSDYRCIYYLAVSLDGFIAAPDGGLDWLLQFPADGADYDGFYCGIGSLVMGRATFDWVREHGEWSYGDKLTAVVTNRPIDAAPGAAFPVAGTPAEILAALAARGAPGPVWIVGGADVAGQFLDAGLIDEIDLQYAPVAIGAGIPVFAGRTLPPLELQWTRAFATGFVEARYRVPRPA